MEYCYFSKTLVDTLKLIHLHGSECLNRVRIRGICTTDPDPNKTFFYCYNRFTLFSLPKLFVVVFDFLNMRNIILCNKENKLLCNWLLFLLFLSSKNKIGEIIHESAFAYDNIIKNICFFINFCINSKHIFFHYEIFFLWTMYAWGCDKCPD